jgi:hypothetical protein
MFLSGIIIQKVISQSPSDNKFRTIDGTFNNLLNPNHGSAGSNLVRLGKAAYLDGISQPFTSKISGRAISNEVFAQDDLDIKDPGNLSDFCWVFGQFIDHEIGFTPNNAERFDIAVPPGDIWFDPNDSGNAVIGMKRNLFDRKTGTNASNPRQHVNMVTSFIDGSAVYGSDEKSANWLRTFKNGKLKVSQGNLLPYNTLDGELNSPLDPSAPEMGNDTGGETKLFVAGDVRANENPLLASIHTLFVREHNRQCEILSSRNPDWTDEQIYQYARKIVGGFIQQILFNEWLPSVGINLPVYSGYQDKINPTVSNEFTGAGFRLGHTMLSSKIKRLNTDGTPFRNTADLKLRDVFFKVSAIRESGGIEPFLQGMGVQVQQQFDTKVVDDIRNFLFGNPGQGGFDLAAINIQRGRERGLPGINELRIALKLPPYQTISDLNPESFTLTRKLESLYRDIAAVDLWVALLSEKKVGGTLFGETLMQFLTYTFKNLRDGDRFFYEIDQVLTEEDKKLIREVKFNQLVLANTTIKKMQSQIFTQVNFPQICDKMDMQASFSFRNVNEKPIANMGVFFTDQQSAITNSNGSIFIKNLSACKSYEFKLATDPVNLFSGLSTKDILIIQNHILGIRKMKTVPALISADMDQSGIVSSLDIILLRKIILGYPNNFSSNNLWQYVSAGTSSLEGLFPNSVTFRESTPYGTREDFYLIKKGDVDGDWYQPEETYLGSLPLIIIDRDFIPGQEINLPIQFSKGGNWSGFQFTLAINSDLVDLQDIQLANLPDFFENNIRWEKEAHLIHVSWNYSGGNVPFFETNQVLFTLKFRAKKQGFLSETFSFSKGGLTPEVYLPDLATLKMEKVVQVNPINDFDTYAPQPNPFVTETRIPYRLNASTYGVLRAYDLSGKLVYMERKLMASGNDYWVLSGGSFLQSGFYLFEIITDTGYKSSGKIWLLQK